MYGCGHKYRCCYSISWHNAYSGRWLLIPHVTSQVGGRLTVDTSTVSRVSYRTIILETSWWNQTFTVFLSRLSSRQPITCTIKCSVVGGQIKVKCSCCLFPCPGPFNPYLNSGNKHHLLQKHATFGTAEDILLLLWYADSIYQEASNTSI